MIALPENMMGGKSFLGDYHLLYIKKDHLQGYYFNLKPCRGGPIPHTHSHSSGSKVSQYAFPLGKVL